MEKEKLIELINSGLSQREISKSLNCSQSNVKYWLKVFKLNTKKNQFNKRDKLDVSLSFEKLCLNCGKGIPNRNLYCNNTCHSEYETKIIYEKIENGDTTFYEGRYKSYLIHKNGEKCMKCDWNEINQTTGKIPIQLEHIDGNSDNNSLNNLKLLCPNCHSLTPTYGALNKGNGRSVRKIKRNKKRSEGVL